MLTTDDLFKGKKVVLFSLPDAFTSICRSKHLPQVLSLLRMEDFKRLGVDSVVCVAVNDEFVMEAWGKGYHAQGKGLLMLGDGDGSFTRALGLDQELEGMGRGRRFLAYVVDGVVRVLNIEAPGPCPTRSPGPRTCCASSTRPPRPRLEKRNK